MENQQQHNTGTTHTVEQATHMAPTSLFANIMNRVEVLHEQASVQTTPEALLAALGDPRWEVRVGALHNLASLHVELPLEPLANALTDEHPAVRAAAVRALGKQGERVPLDHFVLTLQDRDAEVRAMTIRVLEAQREQRVTPLLAHLYEPAQEEAAAPSIMTVEEAESNQTNATASSAAVCAQIARTARGKKLLLHGWLVFSSQFALLRLNLLVGSACLIACYSLTFLLLRANLPVMLTALTWFSLLFTAIGTIITTSIRQDRGLELTLATPSSPHFILLCRWLLIVGPQLLLALLMTCNVALFYSQSISGIAQLWLVPLVAPLLFIAALALVLTLLIKSWLVYIIMSFVPTIRLPDGSWLLQHTAPQLLLILAMLCLAISFIDLPQQTQRWLKGW